MSQPEPVSQDTPCLATTDRNEFYEALEYGDIILFESLDDLAVLAHVIERRPTYHSSVYIGEVDDYHTVMHNVSQYWWSEEAAGKPQRATKAKETESATVDYGLLAPDSTSATPKNYKLLHASRIPHLFETVLTKRGGVGSIRIDDYLDAEVVERVGGDDRLEQHLRKIRSAVALRHSDCVNVDAEQLEKAQKELKTALGKAEMEMNGDGDDGFPAAELVELIPEIAMRPGYRHLKPAELGDDIVELEHNKVDKGKRFICAMFCAYVYEEAELLLSLTHVPLSDNLDRRYCTPRDLWDCRDLVPVAMLVVPPDRGPRFEPPDACLWLGESPRDGIAKEA